MCTGDVLPLPPTLVRRGRVIATFCALLNVTHVIYASLR
nr:MAG TPA: hypothetical protein [Caudoviricetes sp.]